MSFFLLEDIKGLVQVVIYVALKAQMCVSPLLSIQSLVINSAARRTCTVGEIVNLVSADTQKLMDFVVYFNAVWLAPIEIALCLFFLWQVCQKVLFSQCRSFMYSYILTEKPLTSFFAFYSISALQLWQGLPLSF